MSERATTRRTATTAVTYVGKAVSMMRRDAESPIEPLRQLTAYDAEQFLWTVLSEIEMLVKIVRVDEDDAIYADWIEEHAQAIADGMRARRAASRRLALAAKLSNVKGRTPEEAAAFREKAARLLDRPR